MSKKELNFEVPKVMGIIILTPDSFSDGGKFLCPKTLKIDRSKVLKAAIDKKTQGRKKIVRENKKIGKIR